MNGKKAKRSFRRTANLVDGRYSIKDLLNMDRLRELFEQFTARYGIPLGFVSHPDQEVLIAAGWKEICTKFHRECPQALEACYRSNVALSSKCDELGKIYIDHCRNGLIDGVTPIIIKDRHIATLFGGQVMFQPPDIKRFKRQARKYGFDEEMYLAALRDVPVVPEGDFRKTLSFLGALAHIITELGYSNLKLKEEARKLGHEVDERKRAQVRLSKLATMDSQTGLYNHRYLIKQLDAEFSRARRRKRPFSVIMFDIDYFKSINDVYGHLFGDHVLKQFAAELKKNVRGSESVIRWGGEEFAILVPDADRARAIDIAQRIADVVRLRSFGTPEQPIKLKVSAGIASYPEDAAVKGMDLLDIADRIIREAKESGGNRLYSTLDVVRDETTALRESDAQAGVRALKSKIEKLSKRGKQSVIESIFAFAKAIELKDEYTGRHAEMTVLYATEIAKALRLPAEDIEKVKEAAILHDLGKIGVSDKILQKKTALTPREFSVIRKHPQIAADIIRPIQFMHDLIPLILYHHERWDGKGYPLGLKGEDIPIGARIVAVADVFQALTSDRPYRKAFTTEEAMGLIRKGAGRQFDPRIVEVFEKLIRKH